MMPRSKRTVIREERWERLTLRRRTPPLPRFRCAVCGRETGWMTTTEAMARLGRTEREIHDLIAAGTLHFTETEEGRVLVCSGR